MFTSHSVTRYLEWLLGNVKINTRYSKITSVFKNVRFFIILFVFFFNFISELILHTQNLYTENLYCIHKTYIQRTYIQRTYILYPELIYRWNLYTKNLYPHNLYTKKLYTHILYTQNLYSIPRTYISMELIYT